ncbi:MAG: HAMP domain-containing sensor histidine kinase [Parabacteroides sp.]|nr:HAMP domain-containing sensor histidine kinase [Parabacteroides sp.]
MEKRIRWIWLISLVAALAAIGAQGYWLYNQLRYESSMLAEEIAAEVRLAGEEEFRIRKEEAQMTKATYVIERNATYSSEELVDKIKNSFGLRIEPKGTTDLRAFRINLDANLPEDSLFAGVDHALVQYLNPFETARLDSILSIRLVEMRHEIRPFMEQDTLDNRLIPVWRSLSDNPLSPSIAVSYLFAPIDRKGVWVDVALPLHPVLSRMGGQLFLSLFLILLLLTCLGLQIRTIWEQMRLNDLREGFVHTMIHELKRPVQTLKMFVSFLNDKEMRTDEAATEQILQDSMFELDNLSAYLGKLKDMIDVDGQATLLKPSSFNLQALVEKVVRLTTVPTGKEVTFSTAFPSDMPDITVDPVHLANVLSNLIENAIKYSGPKVAIRIVVLWNGQQLECTVSDNGFGIAPEEQTKVFEKFYRSSHLPDKQIPGIGLGLSYVRQIIEAHHGSVFLTSVLGKGTCITINLPL